MKINKIRNTSALMIHSFTSNLPNFKGDTTSINLDLIIQNMNEFKFFLETKNIERITFDDGLFQQIPLIKLFSKYFREVYFFPSGKFIRDENITPVIVNNAFAHNEYHTLKTYPNTFMSSIEIWDLLNNNTFFGIHGWNHYNLNPIELPQQIGDNKFKNIMLALKEDAAASVALYFNMIKKDENKFIQNDILKFNYCTPYNCLSEYQNIYIDFLEVYIKQNLKNLKRKINEIQLEIFSSERISIEELEKEFSEHLRRKNAIM